MELKQTKGEIEAILFAMGEAVELSRIAKAIQQDNATTRKIVRDMMLDYQKEDRGIHIIELEDSFSSAQKENTTILL